MLTPDSSRFWPAETWAPGRAQPSYDKQYVRDWLTASGWDRTEPGPELPDEVVEQTRGALRRGVRAADGQLVRQLPAGELTRLPVDGAAGRSAVRHAPAMAVRTTTQSSRPSLGGRSALATAVRSGSWQRVLRGVYADGDVLDLATRIEAARLAPPAHAVVAGRSALAGAARSTCRTRSAPSRCSARVEVAAVRPGLLVREGPLPPDDLGTRAASHPGASRAAVAARAGTLAEAVGALDVTSGSGGSTAPGSPRSR